MVTFSTVDMFKPLDAIGPDDLPVTGGKAFNCARLKQAGFPVPDGIVVPPAASDADVQAITDDPWLGRMPAGAAFAVRSSGIGEDSEGHSFAGIHDTQLNVVREQLVEAVLVCRRSGGSAQARAYREARHLDAQSALIAVLVQRMVPAVVSGVAFTINPITGADEIVVNAARGLGEALVSGRIDPDEYRLDKRTGAVLAVRLGSSTNAAAQTAALTRPQLADLAALLARIEDHYGAPQDIEWCHDGVAFWIVQSRPVTAARATTPTAGSRPSSSTSFRIGSRTHRVPAAEPRVATSRSRATGPDPLPHSDALDTNPDAAANRDSRGSRPPAQVDTEWTRANLIEVFPEQMSPQVLAAYAEMLNRGQRLHMGRLLAPDSALGPMFKVFRGRMYMNLSQMRRVVSLIGAPAADLLRSLGHPEAIHPDDEVAGRAPLREILRCLPDFIRLAVTDARAERIMRQHEARTRETLARITSVDPRTASDVDIYKMIEWWIAIAPEAIRIVFVMSGVLFREVAIRKACDAVGFPYERLVYPQLAAGTRSVSTQQAVDLVGLAASARHEPRALNYLLANDGSFTDYRTGLAGTSFLERFDRFLDQYGHRGRYESDWAIPRLHEDPAPALFAIRGHLQGRPTDLKAVAERQEADAAGAWRAFEAKLTTWQRWTLLPRVRSTLRRLKKQYVWREQVRSDLTRVLRYARPYHLTLAERFVERRWIDHRDDYFLLRLDEIGRAVQDPANGPGLRAIAAARAEELAAERDLQMPRLMRESQLTRLLAAPAAPVSTGAPLTGLCVSAGSVTAEVVVMRDPSEFAAMKRGAILVAPATDPSWTPLFTLASGVIVEVGGILSHASTIAREYGLPALANVKNATRLLKSGDRVRLDASGGVVELLDR